MHRYGIDKVFAFIESAKRQHDEEIKSVAVAVRMAHHAQAKDFSEYIKQGRKPRPSTPADLGKLRKLGASKPCRRRSKH